MQITYKYINCGHNSHYSQPDIIKAWVVLKCL